MNLLKLALLQVAPGDSLEENLQKGLAVCREAKAKGADIALFPEMWSNGYRLHDRPVAQWQSEAIPVDGAFVSAFSDLAKELGMAICITLLEQFAPAPRNTAVLIDRFGKVQSIYAKVHTCDFDVERNLTPGDGFNAGDCDLQLSRRRTGLQRRIQRFRRRGLCTGIGSFAGYLPASGGRKGGRLSSRTGSRSAVRLPAARGARQRLSPPKALGCADQGGGSAALHPCQPALSHKYKERKRPLQGRFLFSF